MKTINLNLLLSLGLLCSSTLIIAMQKPAESEPYQLKLGGSKAEWYVREMSNKEGAITNLIKVATHNNSGGIIVTYQEHGRGKPWWAIIAPGQTNNDEWLSMDRSTHKPATRPHYTIFANANNIYTIDFDKMKKWTETAPYFSAVLRRIKPSSPLQQILNAAQQRTINQINQLGQINTQEQANKLMNVIKTEILPQVVHISDIASQTERVPVQQLDDILAGEEISLNVENNTVSLSK